MWHIVNIGVFCTRLTFGRQQHVQRLSTRVRRNVNLKFYNSNVQVSLRDGLLSSQHIQNDQKQLQQSSTGLLISSEVDLTNNYTYITHAEKSLAQKDEKQAQIRTGYEVIVTATERHQA